MKLAMALTLDGLVRAMRWKAHDLAEAVEGGYARQKDDRAAPAPADETRRDDNERRRR